MPVPPVRQVLRFQLGELSLWDPHPKEHVAPELIVAFQSGHRLDERQRQAPGGVHDRYPGTVEPPPVLARSLSAEGRPRILFLHGSPNRQVSHPSIPAAGGGKAN